MEEAIEAIKASFSLDASLLIHFATLGYVLGFLFKEQLVLRMLVLFSTIIYIIYYYYFPAQPLWAAIMGSSLIMLANIIGTISLLYDRLPITIDSDHMTIYNSLHGVEPGEFRRLIKAAKININSTDIMITKENKPPTHLYYLVKGKGISDKNGQSFTIPEGRFVGEISFILGGDASASVKLEKGSQYLSWEKSVLIKLLEKKPNLQQVFEAYIARDMATKLASSQSLIN